MSNPDNLYDNHQALNMKVKSVFFILFFSGFSIFAQQSVEKWKIFELTLKGPDTGNPFIDTRTGGKFIHGKDTLSVSGFYDGNGVYKIRFMPQKEGKWSYQTFSNIKSLNKKKGVFTCTSASKNNHGPVAVKDTFYFAYADGHPTPFLRNDLLRLGTSRRQPGGVNSSDPVERIFQ